MSHSHGGGFHRPEHNERPQQHEFHGNQGLASELLREIQHLPPAFDRHGHCPELPALSLNLGDGIGVSLGDNQACPGIQNNQFFNPRSAFGEQHQGHRHHFPVPGGQWREQQELQQEQQQLQQLALQQSMAQAEGQPWGCPPPGAQGPGYFSPEAENPYNPNPYAAFNNPYNPNPYAAFNNPYNPNPYAAFNNPYNPSSDPYAYADNPMALTPPSAADVVYDQLPPDPFSINLEACLPYPYRLPPLFQQGRDWGRDRFYRDRGGLNATLENLNVDLQL